MFGSRICYFSVTFYKLCKYAATLPSFFIVEKETVQFDMLLLLRSPNVEHNLKLSTRILILGWFNYWKYIIASSKVREHLKGSECAWMFFLPWAALLIFYQSINQLYISTVVIKAEKLMGPSRKKKEVIQNYYNIIIVQ